MDVEHHEAHVNGIDLHYVTMGSGPPVIFCHGLPHLWYTWRHQLPAVAATGRQAVAIDVRGMGSSEVPDDPAAYPGQLTYDLLGLLEHLGHERAVFSGFDIGMMAAWDIAVRAPERVEGIIGFNTPILAPPGQPGDAASVSPDFVAMGKEHFYHVTWYNRDPEAAVALLDANTREFLLKLLWALSGGFPWADMMQLPPETTYLDALPDPPPLPWSWFTEADLDVYVEAYAASGFRGVVNHYTSMRHPPPPPPSDPGRLITAPVCFLAADRDMDLVDVQIFGKLPLETMRHRVLDLREVLVVRGAGHLVHMERPDEVNAFIARFLNTL